MLRHADRPGFDPESDGPKASGYPFEWELGGTLVTNRIHGVFTDGERRDWARTVFRWNPVIQKVEQYIFVHGGGAGYGVEIHLPDNLIEASIRTSKDLHGPALRLKDWVHILGPDRFENATCQLSENGEWIRQPGSEMVYRRVKSDPGEGARTRRIQGHSRAS